MPVEISVGPPIITINQGRTFMVTDLAGEIAAESEQGVFCNDTRFVSYYAIFANGEPWKRISSSAVSYYAARIYLTNPPFETEQGPIESDTISLVVTREVSQDGISEQLELTNYGQAPLKFNLEIALRCDFADIFEVRSHKFVRRGRILTEWDDQNNILKVSYKNRDFERLFIYRLLACGSVAHMANGRITIEIELEPGAGWQAQARYELLGSITLEALPDYQIGQESALDRLHAAWMKNATGLTTTNEEFYRFYRQSLEDTDALRLHYNDLDSDVLLPAAGVPWYVTLFGRDSLITSLQNMPVNPKFGLGTLKKLAEFQAKESDDWRDADPGKILHEIRFGELAHFHRIPHTPYYGTADATALYLIVLHETWKWLGDDALLKEYIDVARACLNWLDRFGDFDGDGLQEYRTRSDRGYENMGWKDSGDAVIYPDGTAVKQPKALCELQGYAYDAYMRMAEIFKHLGCLEEAKQSFSKALAIKKLFAEKFWCEDLGFYAFALDGQKQQVKTIASNAGHCLFSGIALPEHAEKVVERLLRNDIWSGWGIRTLAARNPKYNPFSYHCGSVWPHDNGIIAMGFKRYGFTEEAARIARDISAAASYFVGHRVPELYAGTAREKDNFPVQYVGANVPQAWAAGAVFHLTRAMLGLHADAPNHTLFVDPALPKWLPNIRLHKMKVGEALVDLHFWRDKDTTRWDASVQGKLEVKQITWQEIDRNLDQLLHSD